jgi:hypothetical protein
MRWLLVAMAVLLAACATPRDPKPDRQLKPDGESWFCSSEASGMLSVCERTRKKCKRARRYLSKLAHRRGDMMELGKCKKQKRVHCLTAERRLPKEKPAPEEGEDEESDEEADEELEDEADTEGEDATEEDRFVVEDQIWLCYATRDNCEQQRKNMYYFGFTNVSRCGKWK